MLTKTSEDIDDISADLLLRKIQNSRPIKIWHRWASMWLFGWRLVPSYTKTIRFKTNWDDDIHQIALIWSVTPQNINITRPTYWSRGVLDSRHQGIIRPNRGSGMLYEAKVVPLQSSKFWKIRKICINFANTPLTLSDLWFLCNTWRLSNSKNNLEPHNTFALINHPSDKTQISF
jgi:hypothetical protein